jgi:hypothetical protein
MRSVRSVVECSEILAQSWDVASATSGVLVSRAHCIHSMRYTVQCKHKNIQGQDKYRYFKGFRSQVAAYGIRFGIRSGGERRWAMIYQRREGTRTQHIIRNAHLFLHFLSTPRLILRLGPWPSYLHSKVFSPMPRHLGSAANS